jgi:hypothetical protein
MLVVFISIAALAIDIGQLATTRNELQNVADAAALAGAARLGTIYMDELDPAEVPGHTFTREDVVDVVQAVALQNRASGLNVVIYNTATDIRIGQWNWATNELDPETLVESSAVYVKARRDDADPTSPTSRISTFFAGIFGIDTMSVTAEATASLSGPSILAEGEVITPFGISNQAFPNNCEDLIYFSPTTHSCAGWHNFSDDANSSDLSQKIIDIIASDNCDFCSTDPLITNAGLTQDGTTWLYDNYTPQQSIERNLNSDVPMPDTEEGVIFNFIGGETDQFNGEYLKDYDGNFGTPYKTQGNSGEEQELTLASANAPSPIFNMFDYFRYRDGDSAYKVEDRPVRDIDGNILYDIDHVFEKDTIWSTLVPVYEDDPKVNCNGIGTNVNEPTKIVGFAKTIVIQPNPPPAKDLNVIIDCRLSVVEGRGGGGAYGPTLGSIPNLVQ